MIIEVKKRHLFVLAGVILLVGGVFFVNAAVPNPGHDLSELDLTGLTINWGDISGIPSDLADGDDVGVDTNAETRCGSTRFLDGDGVCKTPNDIIRDSTLLSVSTVSDVGPDNVVITCPAGTIRTGCSGGRVNSGFSFSIISDSNGCKGVDGGVDGDIRVVAYCLRID